MSPNCEARGFDGHLGDARAFCEVVSRQTITGAARALGESKGAISRRVSRLEERLGLSLLARSPRRVTPTDEGLAFFHQASAALALLDEASDAARGAATVPRGRLRISAPGDILLDLLAPLVVEFRQTYPQITLELRTSDLLVDLAAERIDLAMRVAVAAPEAPLVGHALGRLDLAFYADPGWIAKHGVPRHPDDLDADQMVLREILPAAPLPLRRVGGGLAHLPHRGGITTSDFATSKALVLAGAGIGLLPCFAARGVGQTGALVAVLPEWRVQGPKLYAVRLGEREEPARSRLFRHFVAERMVAEEMA